MVILVDTSVWTEHLRRTRSRAHLEFPELVTNDPGIVLRIAEVTGLEQRDLR